MWSLELYAILWPMMLYDVVASPPCTSFCALVNKTFHMPFCKHLIHMPLSPHLLVHLLLSICEHTLWSLFVLPIISVSWYFLWISLLFTLFCTGHFSAQMIGQNSWILKIWTLSPIFVLHTIFFILISTVNSYLNTKNKGYEYNALFPLLHFFEDWEWLALSLDLWVLGG